MYDELVKALRGTDFGDTCVLCEHEDMCKGNDCIIIQAADAIEELSKQFDNMNEANIALYGALPKWIPVTEALPDDDDEVLVVAVNTFNHDDRWVSIDWLYSGVWQQHEIVTHWMPLPEPPKEG